MRLIVVLAVALVAIFAAPASSSAARRTKCDSWPGTTVDSNSQVRVFYKFRFEGFSRTYSICARGRTIEPVELPFSVENRDSISRLLLRGRYVTYIHSQCSDPASSCVDEVGWVDPTARVLVRAQSVHGSLDTVVATSAGAAAYLATSADTGERYIRKLDGFGESEVDRGPDVRALRLVGARLYWLNGRRSHSAPARHVFRCGPSGVYTPLFTNSVRVYVLPDPDEEFVARAYACLLPGGKPILLGESDARDYPTTWTGDYESEFAQVAWRDSTCDAEYGECYTRLHSLDLRLGTVLTGEYRPGLVRTMLVNRHGFVAELIEANSGPFSENPGPPSYSVVVLDSASERLIDEGTGIDPSSLSIDDEGAHWQHDGADRSEPLR